MNANELADKLSQFGEGAVFASVKLTDVATMLRQQQAEIEAFKKEAALQRLSDFTQEAESFDRTASHMAGEYVSYPAKTLTDEEIETEWFKVFKPEAGIGKNLTNGIYEFARAILRKAQEK